MPVPVPDGVVVVANDKSPYNKILCGSCALAVAIVPAVNYARISFFIQSVFYLDSKYNRDFEKTIAFANNF